MSNYHELYKQAMDAGLNSDWCENVAYGLCDLDWALGFMDVNSESFEIMTSEQKFMHLYMLSFKAEHPESHRIVDHDCGCRGSAYCDDCIPF